MVDSPYYIEASRGIGEAMNYHILTSAEGRIATVYTLANARLIVDMLNKFAEENTTRRHT